MAAMMVRRSVEEVRAEKRALLRRVNMTGKQLRRAAREDALTGDQWEAFERLRELNFLLRDAQSTRP